LYVRPFGDGATTRLTDSGGGPVSNGRAAWSPDGERVAFVQSDESLVKLRSYLAPGDPTYPEVRATRFARVGGSIPKLRVGVVDAKRKTTRWLPVPDPQEGHYLGQVGWAGNDEVLIEWLSRFRNEREFLLADVRSGTVRRTFRESETAWVVASYETNAGLDWLDGGKAFLVLSEMDGWRHAYSYARDGSKKTLLTPGDFDVIGRAKIDEAGGWLYYYASPDNATQKYLYRVPLSGTGKAERVTPAGQPGTHDYDFSPDAKWALHTHSTFDRPPVTELVEVPSHRVVRVLEDNKALRERMESVTPRPTEFFTLKAGGVSMDAWMIKPKSFDPEKKYPVFVYVYGEPHAQTVLDAWGKSHADYHRVIADLGYLVVSIENRGTPAPKGAAWRRAVFGCLGPITVEDQAAALKELGKQRPYVDLSRVGIWGWSGGGSNTLNALFRRPDTFHVGIAVAPKPQPQLYNAWFQEIYMGTPETNPDGYRRSAPINFAEGLKGDLLIVHGTGETNTHLPITEGLIDRLIELGKRFDYMAYPNRDHGLREGKGTAVHLRLLMARYLTEHLPPGPR
jgi:dipeptidyl-peptidase-4